MNKTHFFLFVWGSLTPAQSVSDECFCFYCAPAVLIRCTIFFSCVNSNNCTSQRNEGERNRKKKNGCQCYGMCVSNCEFIYCCYCSSTGAPRTNKYAGSSIAHLAFNCTIVFRWSLLGRTVRSAQIE